MAAVEEAAAEVGWAAAAWVEAASAGWAAGDAVAVG